MSGLTGTEVPRKGLRVRIPCPPLSSEHPQKPRVFGGVFLWHTRVCHECAERWSTTNLSRSFHPFELVVSFEKQTLTRFG